MQQALENITAICVDEGDLIANMATIACELLRVLDIDSNQPAAFS